MSKFSRMMRLKYKETKKSAIVIYLILRILVILCAIAETMQGNYWNTFLCIVTLLLFTIPTLIRYRFKIELPNALEALIYLFIFAADILGEINHFYIVIPYWDTILHTINGFVCAGIGFSLVDLLNNNSKNIHLSPIYVAIVAFCFSMTVGVLWEFFEYGVDHVSMRDMQRDTIVTEFASTRLNPKKENIPVAVKDISSTEIHTKDGNTITIENGYLDIGINDTMKDLFVNLIGAIMFSILGYFYVKNRNENGLAGLFMPQKVDY